MFAASEDTNPFDLFSTWLDDAEKAEPRDANAMALASVGEGGMPAIRMVLLKEHSESGFVFYTNYESRKGHHLINHPKAALLFHWKSLNRQIRIEGEIEQVSKSEADAYFASRPRQSQIGAWASKQSRPLESRFALEKQVAHYTMKYPVGAIPRPAYWSGFRLVPRMMEFWSEGAFRLHDRFVFEREDINKNSWTTTRLYP